MKHANVGWLLISSAFFAAGYAVHGLLPLTSVEFKKEIEPLDVVSMALSFALFIYISIMFERTKEQSRLKKEIVINKSNNLMRAIEKFQKRIGAGSLTTSEVTTACKEISMEFYALLGFTKIADYEEKSFETRFLAELRAVRSLSGSTPKDARVSNQDIKVCNGQLKYSSQRTAQLVRGLGKMIDTALEEQLRIINI